MYKGSFPSGRLPLFFSCRGEFHGKNSDSCGKNSDSRGKIIVFLQKKHFFLKKVAVKFGGTKKMCYLCTRKSEMRLKQLRKLSMKIENRGVAQPGSAPVLGTGGRRFESCRPDFFSIESFLPW